ncbi:MFS transporter [Orbaceae bacterium ac157xtp]
MNSNLFRLVCFGSFLTSFSYGIMLTFPLFLSRTLALPLVMSGKIISMGIIGVILSIVLIPISLMYIRINRLACIGALIYSSAIIFALSGNNLFLYISGFMLGVGWGIIYTLSPIMVSSTSLLKELSKNFMLISAFNMLGAGLSPMLVKLLTDQGVLIEYIFIFAAFSSIVGSVIFFKIEINNEQKNNNSPVLPIVKDIFTTKLVIPLVMVLLGACIFSSMMNFQFVFAEKRNLDFSIFYVAYTTAILFARFFLTKFILKFEQKLVIICLLILMLFSLCLFLFTTNNLLYIIPSGLLGISYGLVYPLIQTQMVKDVDPNKRSTFLTIFSLSYFIGVFGYPYFFTLGMKLCGILISFLILISLCIFDIICGLILLRKR